MSLAAHPLDRRGAHAWLHGDQIVEAAYSPDVRIVAGTVDHRNSWVIDPRF
jgi:hypothetical protein